MVDVYYLAASIEITTANNTIIFREDGVAVDRTASVDPGTYYLYGDGTESGDILTAVTDALNAASTVGATYTVESPLASWGNDSYVYSFVITTDSTSWELRGASASTTFPLAAIGVEAANTGFAASNGSSLNPTHAWAGNQPPATIDVTRRARTVSQRRTPEGQRYTFTIASSLEMREIEFAHLSEQTTFGDGSVYYDGRGFSHFFDVIGDGRPVQLYSVAAVSETFLDDITSTELVGTFALTERSCSEWQPVRTDGRAPLYSFTLEFEEWIE